MERPSVPSSPSSFQGVQFTRRRAGRFVAAAFAGLLVSGLLALPDATARVSFDSPYTFDQTFNGALRMLRVDLQYTITEKDPKAGYVMFEYRTSENGNKATPGAIEVMPSGNTVKVVVQLSQMPRYHEQVLANTLTKKLRDDYGEPPTPSKPIAPPAPSGDAGTD